MNHFLLHAETPCRGRMVWELLFSVFINEHSPTEELKKPVMNVREFLFAVWDAQGNTTYLIFAVGKRFRRLILYRRFCPLSCYDVWRCRWVGRKCYLRLGARVCRAMLSVRMFSVRISMLSVRILMLPLRKWILSVTMKRKEIKPLREIS